jgi:hypothetical protein
VTFKVRHVPRVVLSVGHRVLARVEPEIALAMGLQLFFDTHPATWDDKPLRDAGIEPRPASEFITASVTQPALRASGSHFDGAALRWRERREPWTQRPHSGLIGRGRPIPARSGRCRVERRPGWQEVPPAMSRSRPGRRRRGMPTLTNPGTGTTEPDTTSRRSPARIAGWVITGYVTLFLAFDSITHLVREQHAVDFNNKIGAPGWFPVVCGAVLAVCLVAFHVPRTRVLGAVLLTSYLGGATAVNLVVGQPAFSTAFAIVTGVLVWAGLWPRDERARRLL